MFFQQLFEVFYNFLPGLLIAVVTSWLTVNFSLKRFHAERWWERKVEAYTQITQALHALMAYNKRIADAAECHETVEEEEYQRILKEYERAKVILMEATDTGAFIICEEAALVLEELNKRKRPRIGMDVPPWEPYEEEYKAFRNALDKFKQSAKRDLKV